MELKYLRTFYYVAQTLNLSEAAKALNFTQPAVSKQIKNLESEIGRPLFMRIGNKNYLTPTGMLLKEHADEIMKLMDNFEKELVVLHSNPRILRIGADLSLVTSNLQPIIAQFYQQNSNVQTQIFTIDSATVITQIENNELDVGFISGDYENPHIEKVEVSKDPIVVVVSKKIFDQYSLTTLKKRYPLIRYRSQSPYAVYLNRFCEENQLQQKGHIQFTNLEAVKSAAMQGVGISVITKDVVCEELASGALIEIPESYLSMEVPTYMIYHKKRKAWTIIRSLQKLVEDLWQST